MLSNLWDAPLGRGLLVSLVGHLVVLGSLVSLSSLRWPARGTPSFSAPVYTVKLWGAPPSVEAPPSPTESAPPREEPKAPPKKAAVTTKRVVEKKRSPPVQEARETPRAPVQRPGFTTGAGVGEGMGSLTIEGEDFPFPYYLQQIVRKLGNLWRNPVPRGPDPLKAVVRFTILADGRLEDIELEQEAGHLLFDQAALRAVINANPLPPLPQGYGGDLLIVHFEFLLTAL